MENQTREKKVLGLIEKIKIIGEESRIVTARIDTGARWSSIDLGLASQLKLGPIHKIKHIVSASSNGKTMRPLIKAKIKLKGRVMRSSFSLVDRSHMRYKVLIGVNVLKRGFIIDPQK